MPFDATSICNIIALSVARLRHSFDLLIKSTSTALYAFLHQTHCNASKQIIPKMETTLKIFEAATRLFMVNNL